MEIMKPCVSCGKLDIRIDKIDLGNSDNWFVKCKNCVGVTTITHAVRDEAIRQWNNQWVWSQIDILTKRATDSELREYSNRQNQIDDTRVLQFRYEKMTDEYVKYRMLYSGTAGNMNLDERKTLMKKEIASELGWTI